MANAFNRSEQSKLLIELSALDLYLTL